jgi:hypothetical protein
MSKEKDSNAWMQTLWRPMMGWMYMLICLADMMVFPVLWALWQGFNHVPITQWNPLTLQGAGLFHIAMGAVLGISAFGRTQEKLAGTAANPTATEQISVNTTNMSGVPAGMGGMNNGMGGMNNGMGGSFGGQTSGGFGSPAPSFGSPAPSFGSPAPSFGSPAPSFGSPSPAAPAFGSASAPMPAPSTVEVTAGFGGKKAPAPQDDPIL